MTIIGIDVSKAKLDCAWSRVGNKIKTKVLPNSQAGCKTLIAWALSNTGGNISDLHFVMEATGIYHENIANSLYKAGAKVSIVNPAYVKHYAQSLGIRTKNDKKDSVILARYGVKESPSLWHPFPPEVKLLKALFTRLDAIEKDLQREKNRQEKSLIIDTPKVILDSIDQGISFLEAKRNRINKLIDDHINSNEKLKKNRELLLSIPGIGQVTSQRMVMLMAAYHFSSAHQCAAFLGLVPVEKESGTSIKKRPRLAKNGNPVFRAKLYMAAVSAIKYNPDTEPNTVA